MALPLDTKIRAFFTDDQSVNQLQQNEIRKHFQHTVTELFEYGTLEFDQDYNLKLSPSQINAVRPTKRPLIPLVIALIPPDTFPGGEFRTTRIPSPQDIPVRLIRTQRNANPEGGNQLNVEAVRPIASIVPEQNNYLILSTSRSVQLDPEFRTEGNQVALARLPIHYTSSNPDVADVTAEGLVTFAALPTTPVTVTMRATTQDQRIVTATVTFTTDPSVDVEPNPPASPAGLDNTIETLVSNEDNLGTFYLESLKDRYEVLRTSGPQAQVSLEDQLDTVTQRRQRIADIYQEASDTITERRGLGANEANIRRQVEVMKNLPPLVMYVNPESFSVSYQHLISDGDRGRDGFIVEHWGLEQPTISASGKIGGAYISTVGSNGRAAGGLTRALRRNSAAFQSFMSLYHSYRNNSYIFNDDGKISLLGSVKIFYDDTIYTGTFESFTIQETEDSPFDLSYSFAFTVRFEDKILENPLNGDL